ncbi:MAG: hypothetical protein WCP19_13565 [Chloroflexota bacterium]
MESENKDTSNIPTKPVIGDRIGKRPVRIGEPCPRCGLGILDYNGMLDLECPVCAFTEGPGGGCT